MKIRQAAATIVILASAVLYGFSAIETTNGGFFSIEIDAGRPHTVEWPCEVAIVGDEGEKGLRIGVNVGRGWRGEAGGQATYKFYVPRAGTYHVWAYGLWFDECANAVFAQIDDSEKAIVGNDPIYGQWHWVRGFGAELSQGSHTLILSNHSDHVSIQKILFTNAESMRPGEYEVVFSNLFYDGFDGCDHGNFTAWRQVSGEWTIDNLKADAHNPENAILGRSEDEALILYGNEAWEGYSVNLSVRVMEAGADAAVGICFGVRDAQHYYQVRWQDDEIECVRRDGNEVSNFEEFEVAKWGEGWHRLEITAHGGVIKVILDNGEPFEVSADGPVLGGIGLWLEGNIEAQFDDIHVRRIESEGDE